MKKNITLATGLIVCLLLSIGYACGPRHSLPTGLEKQARAKISETVRTPRLPMPMAELGRAFFR
jgi:hypothetical protein